MCYNDCLVSWHPFPSDRCPHGILRAHGALSKKRSDASDRSVSPGLDFPLTWGILSCPKVGLVLWGSAVNDWWPGFRLMRIASYDMRPGQTCCRSPFVLCHVYSVMYMYLVYSCFVRFEPIFVTIMLNDGPCSCGIFLIVVVVVVMEKKESILTDRVKCQTQIIQ